jgi:hypothetical protein
MSWKWTERITDTIPNTGQLSGLKCLRWRTVSSLGDLDVIAAGRQLNAFCDGVEPEIGALLRVFVAIHSETDALPIGEERALCNAEALAREDVKISAAEERWRHEAITAATQLVQLLE